MIAALQGGDIDTLRELFNDRTMEQQQSKARAKMWSKDAMRSLIEAIITKDDAKARTILTNRFLDISESKIRDKAANHGLLNPFTEMAAAEIAQG